MSSHYLETVPAAVKGSIQEIGRGSELHQVVKSYQRDFKWVIEDFMLWASGKANLVHYYERSPSFQVGKDDPPRKMFLTLYPTDRTRAGCFSINLNLEENAPIQVDLKIGLERTDKRLARCMKYTQLSLASLGMGYAKILSVPMDSLLEPHSDLLPNGNLTIVCSITIFDKYLTPAKRKLHELNHDTSFTQEKKAKKSKYMIAQLMDTFTDFNANPRQAARFSDFKINVEGKTFDCHKIFLALRSEVFSAMFEHNVAETRQNEVTITDLDASTVGNMLNFIYTDSVKDETITAELLAAANKYDIPLLRQTCEESLLGRLSIHNAADVWLAFNLHGSKHAQDSLLKFLAEFWSKVHISHNQRISTLELFIQFSNSR